MGTLPVISRLLPNFGYSSKHSPKKEEGEELESWAGKREKINRRKRFEMARPKRVSLVRQINVQSGSGSDDVSTTIGGDGTMRDNGTWSLNQDNALCTLHLAKSEWINGYNG